MDTSHFVEAPGGVAVQNGLLDAPAQPPHRVDNTFWRSHCSFRRCLKGSASATAPPATPILPFLGKPGVLSRPFPLPSPPPCGSTR